MTVEKLAYKCMYILYICGTNNIYLIKYILQNSWVLNLAF